MTDREDFDARRILKDTYGLEGDVTPLPSEYDHNFSVETPGGERFVLKVMRVGYDEALVDFQRRALEHLARRVPHVAVPRSRPTGDGRPTGTAVSPGEDPRIVWMLGWVPGRVLADCSPHTPELLQGIGFMMGTIDGALADFDHAAASRRLKWDLAHAGWIAEHLDHVDSPSRRALVERAISLYEKEVVPVLPELRRGIVHNDANDCNVVVGCEGRGSPLEARGVVDFGDMLRTITVSEPAIAAAYALLGKPDPLAAVRHVVAGYHRAYPLDPAEAAVLFPLVCTRLAVSVVNSARRKRERPDDPYVTVSEDRAWGALERLSRVHPHFAHYTVRDACGWEPVPHSAAAVSWLRSIGDDIGPVLETDLRRARCRVADLGVGSMLLGADPASAQTARLTDTIFGLMRSTRSDVVVGRYDEVRPLYSSPIFGDADSPVEERRTIHLGMDLFVEAGTAVHAPLAGTVHRLANNARAQDYGPLVILRHETGGGEPFFTLYGHLGEDAFDTVSPGDAVERGQRIGSVGSPPGNGDWPPHLHFQIITDLLDMDADFPGVGYASQRDVWRSLSPDPNVILGVPPDRFPPRERSLAALRKKRLESIGSSLRLSYREPLHITRGWMQYLYDHTGRKYIDLYNNVQHVGHSHPRVVEAVQQQAALLNTNTRYLHPHVVRYAERLAATMPEPLNVCYFLNSASEANELALRLARTHTGRRDIVVHETAYHGHTTTLVDISPYKFDGPGGEGAPPWVHVAPMADDYRGPYKRDDPDAGRKYADHISGVITRIPDTGPAAMIAESCPSVGGQIIFPPGYLQHAYHLVRRAGGLCIADEVQVGLGRLGTHFWGFETQGVVPDIVVLGKPIGNGFPLAAVVTTPDVAASFDNGMEFFSTFGGNPVSCAAGLAVLEVVQLEKLQHHARRVGERLLNGLKRLQDKHPIVGDVRGSGLFVGVELVRDRATLEPAAEEASYAVNRLRQCGVLTGTDGPHHNVIKIRGPLALAESDIDVALHIIDGVLGEDPVRA